MAIDSFSGSNSYWLSLANGNGLSFMKISDVVKCWSGVGPVWFGL